MAAAYNDEVSYYSHARSSVHSKSLTNMNVDLKGDDKVLARNGYFDDRGRFVIHRAVETRPTHYKLDEEAETAVDVVGVRTPD